MKTETAAERRIIILKDILKNDIKIRKEQIKSYNRVIHESKSVYDLSVHIAYKVNDEAAIKACTAILDYLSKPLTKN